MSNSNDAGPFYSILHPAGCRITTDSGEAMSAIIGVSRGSAPKSATYIEAVSKIATYRAQEKARMREQQAAWAALQDQDTDHTMDTDAPQTPATPPRPARVLPSSTSSRGPPSTRTTSTTAVPAMPSRNVAPSFSAAPATPSRNVAPSFSAAPATPSRNVAPSIPASPATPSRNMSTTPATTPSANRYSFVMPKFHGLTSGARTSSGRSDWSDLSETLSSVTQGSLPPASGQSTTDDLPVPILVPISRSRLESSAATGGLDIRLQIPGEGNISTVNSAMLFHLRQAAEYAVSSDTSSNNLPNQEDRSRFVTETAREMFEKLRGAKAKPWWAIVKGVGPGVYHGSWECIAPRIMDVPCGSLFKNFATSEEAEEWLYANEDIIYDCTSDM